MLYKRKPLKRKVLEDAYQIVLDEDDNEHSSIILSKRLNGNSSFFVSSNVIGRFLRKKDNLVSRTGVSGPNMAYWRVMGGRIDKKIREEALED